MMDHRVYVKAAKLIASGDKIFSCVAVMHYSGIARELYETVMSNNRWIPTSWFERDDNGRTRCHEEKQLHRSLALLFMAEYVKDGGR